MDKRNIRRLKKFKENLIRDYDIQKMILFGSRAKDSYKKYSDFDILLVSNNFDGVDKLKRSPALYLKWDLNYPVDFLCYTPAEFNKLKKQITIVREAVKEGIVI